MNAMALPTQQHADVVSIDEARDCEPVLQLAAAIGADGEVRDHYATLTKFDALSGQSIPTSLVPACNSTPRLSHLD